VGQTSAHSTVSYLLMRGVPLKHKDPDDEIGALGFYVAFT